MLVALVREKIVLLRWERDSPVVHGFHVTRWRRVNRIDFDAGRLLRVYVSAKCTELFVLFMLFSCLRLRKSVMLLKI